MRIIPRNTKVATEFFTGVSLADIVVGTVGILIIFFVIISKFISGTTSGTFLSIRKALVLSTTKKHLF